MPQQPFTANGISAKQAELSAMSAQNRQTQANLMRNDFRSWLSTNFSFTTSQQTYLNGIANEFIVLASALTAFAVENQLTITVNLPQGDTTTFKLIHIGGSIGGQYSPTGFTPSGQLVYTIEYQ